MTTGSITVKECARCHSWIALEFFGTFTRKGKTYVKSYCRPCEAELVKKAPSQTKEAVNERVRGYRSTLVGRVSFAEQDARRRAKDYGNAWEVLDYIQILLREDGICYLCGELIPANVPSRSPSSLSFDHRMPLSWGGPHLAWNVYPVHLRCNGLKGRKVIG
jgi:hypothetical protein